MIRKESICEITILHSSRICTACCSRRRHGGSKPTSASTNAPDRRVSADHASLRRRAAWSKRPWILYLDRVEQEQSIEILRKAVQVDPDFAMGHEFLAQISLDSAEQVANRRKHLPRRNHATDSEQLVIEWYQDAADHKLISAITKMNDVLNQYPHDKWVVWMTTWWLHSSRRSTSASSAVYERSGITDSPGLINNMGYNYALRAAVRQGVRDDGQIRCSRCPTTRIRRILTPRFCAWPGASINPSNITGRRW